MVAEFAFILGARFVTTGARFTGTGFPPNATDASSLLSLVNHVHNKGMLRPTFRLLKVNDEHLLQVAGLA